MNILVTGANGQLGNEMRIVSRPSSDKYIFTDVAELDICDASAVRAMVKAENVGAIINCAAFTNVDAAEDNFDLAERLNCGAVANLAAAMKEVDGLLVHVSTDYVFGADAHNTPIAEDAAPAPSGVYGVTKLHGEQAVLSSGCKYVILRTAWLYSEFGKNFVKTMLSLTSTKPVLKVVCDQVGTPTYALDLAKAIYHIVENRLYEGHSGIYNFSNEGVCSWFDFTKTIQKMSGNTACSVEPCRSCEFPSKVQRPSYSVLDKSAVKNTFGVKVPYWTDSLEECIRNLQNAE